MDDIAVELGPAARLDDGNFARGTFRTEGPWRKVVDVMADTAVDKALVRFDVEDGIGVLTIDNPPVNALGPGVRDGIIEALEQGEADPSVKAMVMIASTHFACARHCPGTLDICLFAGNGRDSAMSSASVAGAQPMRP